MRLRRCEISGRGRLRANGEDRAKDASLSYANLLWKTANKKGGGGVAGPPIGETKTKQGGTPHFFLQLVDGLRVLCEFMAFGGPFGAGSARGAGFKSSESARARGSVLAQTVKPTARLGEGFFDLSGGTYLLCAKGV